MPPPLSRGATGEEAAPMDNSVKSDGVLLLHVHREALGAGQLLAGGDLHVLISNNAVQLGIGFHNGVLHEHAVLDDGTFLTLTPRNSTQFSTVPSMTQPSARMESVTLQPGT